MNTKRLTKDVIDNNPGADRARVAEYLFEINAISLAEAREDGYDPRINERMQKIK